MKALVKAQSVALVPVSEPRCSICSLPSRREIEEALVQPGESMRSIARRFGLVLSSLLRHRKHMGTALDQARALREVEGVSELYRRQKRTAARLAEIAEGVLSGVYTPAQGATASQLLATSQRFEEMLSKYGQAPGFAEQKAGNTHINAPEARILIAPSQPQPQLPAPSEGLDQVVDSSD